MGRAVAMNQMSRAFSYGSVELRTSEKHVDAVFWSSRRARFRETSQAGSPTGRWIPGSGEISPNWVNIPQVSKEIEEAKLASVIYNK